MANEIANRRKGHPYWMYDALRSQPDVARQLLKEGWQQARDAARALSDCRRLFLVGIGSSHHVALAGEAWLRHLTGADVHALFSLEAALYSPQWQPGDGMIVISHRGGAGYTREALEAATAMGLPTVAITGVGSALPPGSATLETSPIEVSNCHTMGYSAALVVMAQLATALAEEWEKPIPPEWETQLQTVPDVLQGQLGSEGTMQQWAQLIPRQGTIVIVGAGPHQATANEIALKVQEAVSRPVMAMTVEQLAHGPMACLKQGDLVITTLPAGARAELRMAQLTKGLQELGIPVWGLYPGESVAVSRRYGRRNESEWLGPLTGLVPLQLLTYHWALQENLDPDWNRLEKPAHDRAKRYY